MAKPILAIMYDFDKTLSTTDMQNYGFIPALGLTPDQFWGATGEVSACLITMFIPRHSIAIRSAVLRL